MIYRSAHAKVVKVEGKGNRIAWWHLHKQFEYILFLVRSNSNDIESYS